MAAEVYPHVGKVRNALPQQTEPVRRGEKDRFSSSAGRCGTSYSTAACSTGYRCPKVKEAAVYNDGAYHGTFVSAPLKRLCAALLQLSGINS